MKKVQTAVIPVAGLGTRLFPLTRSIPKAMLPVGDKPVLQCVVEELSRAGIRHVIFVTGGGEEIIRNHFLPPAHVVENLERMGKSKLLEDHRFDNIIFSFVRQEQPLGSGHALLCAREAVNGKSFVLAFGDAIIEEPSGLSLVQKMSEIYEAQNADVVVAVEKVDEEMVSRYGIIDPIPGEQSNYLTLRGVVEKPRPAEAPSHLAIAARYVFSPGIFSALGESPPKEGREWQLTDAINHLAKTGNRVLAVALNENQTRHEVGSLDSYYRVFYHFTNKEENEG